jgi:uncharacterized phiE125 gp8 family phage protein
MASILLNGPAVEPLALADAKAFLRVEHADDDDVIAALVAGARIHIEAQTRRALITQSWRLVRDAWPADGRIAAAPAPLRSVTAARVYKDDGTTTDIDTQAFVLDTASAPGVIAFAPWSLAQPGRAVGGIEIEFEAGYGDTAADVPEPLRQALRLLLSHWYENRGLVADHVVALLPATVAALIAPYRVLSL